MRPEIVASLRKAAEDDLADVDARRVYADALEECGSEETDKQRGIIAWLDAHPLVLAIYRCILNQPSSCQGWFSWNETEPEQSYIEFHGKYLDATFHRDGSLPYISVEYRLFLFAYHATTDCLLNTPHCDETLEYGEPILYGDDPLEGADQYNDERSENTFLSRLWAQCERAAQAAWDAGWRTCGECGYHYHMDAPEDHLPHEEYDDDEGGDD